MSGSNKGIQTSPEKANVKSPLNMQMKDQRESADVYTPDGRQRVIKRILQNAVMRQDHGKTQKSVSLEMFNGEPMMVNPPYGYLPFALAADKDALEKAINYCGMKKRQFEQSGDYFRMWMYAQRQSLLAGVMSHLIRFKLVNS